MRDGHAGIRLQNDYGCRWPIWWVEGLQAEPEVLGLSDDLEAQILAWAQHFQSHFDPFTRWDAEDSRDTHAKLAEELRQRLVAEIGHDLEVVPRLWELRASNS